MTDTFTWRVHATASGEGAFDVRKSQFADGYSQRVPSGLNNDAQSWNVTFGGYDVTGMLGVRDPLAFIRAKKGAESFFWTPPLGTQGYYVANNYRVTPQGGNFFTVSCTFEQVFGP